MKTADVANQLVALCKKGEFEKATETLYSQDIVSVEPMAMGSMPAETRGYEAVKGKGDWWVSNHEIHSCTVEGPFLHGDRFIVKFDMDVTNKPSGKRMQMSETGLYTVANGKVVREEFFYAGEAAK